jgi:hypothetical protein
MGVKEINLMMMEAGCAIAITQYLDQLDLAKSIYSI